MTRHGINLCILPSCIYNMEKSIYNTGQIRDLYCLSWYTFIYLLFFFLFQVECSVCGKKLSQRQNLDRHMRIHTGEKPYRCSVCGRRFSQGGSLTSHMRSHTGDKPYACSVCGKEFRHRITLTKHMRTHSVENTVEKKLMNEQITIIRL